MKLTSSRKIAVVALCFAFGAFATASLAKDEHAHGEHAAGGAEPGMSAADMEAMMAVASPGPPHAALASCVGNWKSEVKSYWMDPSQPVVSTGSVHFEMELGGRVLNGSFKGEMGGMPFEGHSLDGYDNAKGKYWSIWLDNMGTGYMLSTGTASADGKTITYTGTSWDPMQGKDVNYKMITKIVDANTRTFEMYAVEGHVETKQMEITYTRS